MNYDKQETRERNRKFLASQMAGGAIVGIILTMAGLLLWKWLPVLWDLFWAWIILK